MRPKRHTEVFPTTSAMHRTRVKLFISPDCPYCAEARELLDEAGVRYSTVRIASKPAASSQPSPVSAHNRHGRGELLVVPRLMIGAHHIGGLDRIRELHSQGKLREVLDQG